MRSRKSKVIVGLSGGVDSSVAALLLLRAGYEVEAVFMKNWDDPDNPECTAAADLEDARRVCAQLEIPLHKVSFTQDYQDRVFAHFLAEYRAGRTPNPDVLCNKEIKFRAFLDYADSLGADRIATGHYARIVYREGQPRLYKGVDASKDQSYFLHALNRDQLARSLFPLGELDKSEVRAMAWEAGLPTAQKKDSTGICFIGERDFRRFLSRYLASEPGPIRTPDGVYLGNHGGLSFYTLGQRQGLGIGGQPGFDDRPWYVVDKDLDNNVLIVGQGHDHPLLYRRRLRAQALNWITSPPEVGRPYAAKIRYRQADEPCSLAEPPDSTAAVCFERPQRAVTPGQSVVFYDGAECLGGGVIETSSPE